MTTYETKTVRVEDPDRATGLTLQFTVATEGNHALTAAGFGDKSMWVSELSPNGGRMDHDRFRFCRENSDILTPDISAWVKAVEFGEIEDGETYTVGANSTLA